MDLISCRNVLIYLENKVQDKIITTTIKATCKTQPRVHKNNTQSRRNTTAALGTPSQKGRFLAR
jgi:chemotaxis methyl-accepting protein methylase